MIKKFLCASLAFVLLFSLTACLGDTSDTSADLDSTEGKSTDKATDKPTGDVTDSTDKATDKPTDNATDKPTDDITDSTDKATDDATGGGNDAPDTPSGEVKKAIFVGNSFIYWGGCVTFLTNDDANDPIRLAGGDKGYFNEICKANGLNIDVYNYTFGGKNLSWIYENKLKSLPQSFLDDIDYVFISEAGENSSSFQNSFYKVADLFKNAEEIAYLAHAYTYSKNATHIINALPSLAESGVKIVAWGELVYDVYNGKVSVPGATLTYNKNTFIKNMASSEMMDENAAVTSISGKGDNYHQNPLSGYITAQMCFSAITYELAEGQRYDFCWDKTIAPQYDLENFLTYQYGKNQTSNFIEVFNSPSDMLGLQILMDQYFEKYN
jgi:hypothetical protein